MIAIRKSPVCPVCKQKVENYHINRTTGRINFICSCGKMLDLSEEEYKSYMHSGKQPNQ